MAQHLLDHAGIINDRDDAHRLVAFGAFQRVGVAGLPDQVAPLIAERQKAMSCYVSGQECFPDFLAFIEILFRFVTGMLSEVGCYKDANEENRAALAEAGLPRCFL